MADFKLTRFSGKLIWT